MSPPASAIDLSNESAALALASASLLCSVFVAIATVVANRKSSRIAQEALQISKEAALLREPKLGLYLIDQKRWTENSTEDRTFGVNVRIGNPSDRSSSLTSAELRVGYRVSGKAVALKIPHGIRGGCIPREAELQLIQVPTELPSNGAVSGWLVFSIESDLLGGQAADRYTLVINDIHGNVVEYQLGPASHEYFDCND